MSTQRNLPYKLLIFDWDGTLMDSEARIVNCLRAAIADAGHENRSNDQLKDVIGLGLQEAIRQLFPDKQQSHIIEMADHYRRHYLETNDTPSELFKGAAELLEQLEHQGYWLAIATGKGRQGLNQVLDYTGLHHRFHATRCASETLSKPHPQMLHEILDQLGMQARDALMIGDTEYDMQMASNASMASLAVSYGVHATERLLKHKPIGCLHDIRELSGFLKNL